jgi:hypothetical protein
VDLGAALGVAVEQLLEGAAQLLRAHAQHEADGVHEVGLARAVGPDDGGEVLEGTDVLVALVGLEVLHLQPVDAALRAALVRLEVHGCGGGDAIGV